MIIRRVSLVVLSAAVAALAVLAVRKMGWHQVTAALTGASPGWLVLGLAALCAAEALRGVAWWAALRASLPAGCHQIADVMSALFIGVLVSSTLPASLGEPSRAFVIARRCGRPFQNLATVAGTLVSQTLLNVVALLVLGLITLLSANLFAGQHIVLAAGAALLALLIAVVLLAPVALRRGASHPWIRRAESVATQVRAGLVVFRRGRLAAITIGGQLGAWSVQLASVYVMLVGFHLAGRAGLLGAVSVLFAINVTLLLPITPGDIGVYQAAAAGVLHAGWQIPYSSGVAFGVALQAAELVAALILGVPALVREGLSWRHLAGRPLGGAPVTLPPAVQPQAATRGGA